MGSLGGLSIKIIRIAEYGGSSTVAFVLLGKVVHAVSGPNEMMDKLFQ